MSNPPRQEMRILVLGVGRIGAVTAVGLAHLGHEVTGVDSSARRIAQLADGSVDEVEPGLRSALRGALRFRRLEFATSAAGEIFDLAFLCVDTPALASGDVDLSQLLRAITEAAPLLTLGGILVTRSTVPVGTGDVLAERLRELGRRDLEVVHVPEFLREGYAWEDFREADRIVIGGESAEAIERVQAVFDGLRRPILTCDRRTAELAKYVANAFLATSVSFANEMADLSNRLGADTTAMFAILHADSRIGGAAYLTPGLGFGGHCLPKDTAALERLAAEHGQALLQLRATRQINHGRTSLAVDWLRETLGGLSGKRICLAGLAFKPGTDDTRGSQALYLGLTLAMEGAQVYGWDANVRTCAGPVEVRSSLVEAVRGADALVITYAWAGWRNLEPFFLRSVMRTSVVFDAPGILDAACWQDAGFKTNQPGHPRAAMLRHDADFS